MLEVNIRARKHSTAPAVYPAGGDDSYDHYHALAEGEKTFPKRTSVLHFPVFFSRFVTQDSVRPNQGCSLGFHTQCSEDVHIPSVGYPPGKFVLITDLPHMDGCRKPPRTCPRASRRISPFPSMMIILWCRSVLFRRKGKHTRVCLKSISPHRRRRRNQSESIHTTQHHRGL